MYSRTLALPDHSFFLFGPRSTGKSTWLRKVLPDAKWFDLLRNDVFLSLSRDPARLRQEVLALEPDRWIVIDEIQRIPALLTEVHALIAERPDAYRFALSGSSARKLRRMDVDLLAGRVFERGFFPLSAAEAGEDFDLERSLAYGCLPKVVAEPEHSLDILQAYAHTYLQQEIQQEALVKDLGSFHRFLEVAALMNGQVVNASAIARDAGVARTTVERYLSVLIDTLIGYRLPAWRPRLKVKESQKPKFYLFDPGVVRALSGSLHDPVEKAERGPLLETLVLHELRAHIDYAGIGGKLSYWRTPAGKEVDFVWSRGNKAVAIEVKASPRWRGTGSRALKELAAAGVVQRTFAVYLGDVELVDGPVRVMPVAKFCQMLTEGEILFPSFAGST